MSNCWIFFSTHHRLVGREHLAQAEHQHHEPKETKQMFAHGPPVHRAWRCVHPVPDVHVKVPVHLKYQHKTCYQSTSSTLCTTWFYDVWGKRGTVSYRFSPVPPQIWMVPLIPRVSLVVWSFWQHGVVTVSEKQQNINTLEVNQDINQEGEALGP